MRKWIARAILALIVVALFLPFGLPQVPLTSNYDAVTVPFGVAMLAIIAVLALCVGFVVGFIWLLITAGVIKEDK